MKFITAMTYIAHMGVPPELSHTARQADRVWQEACRIAGTDILCNSKLFWAKYRVQANDHALSDDQDITLVNSGRLVRDAEGWAAWAEWKRG